MTLTHLMQNTEEIDAVVAKGQSFIFTGGACSILHPEGNKRNPMRDDLLTWLDNQGVFFFEPQVHPDTHGISYNYDIHGPAEQAARRQAEITLYEISSLSYGGVTLMEATRDATLGKNVVIWFTGEEFDEQGHPLFNPLTEETLNGVQTANLMRKNLASWFAKSPNVRYCRTLDEVKTALIEMGGVS